MRVRVGQLLLSLWLLGLLVDTGMSARRSRWCSMEASRVKLLVSAGVSGIRAQDANASRTVSGERLYQIHCAACHGPRGEGAQGPTLATPSMTRATTEELLLKIIKDGLPGTEMPGSRLDSEELKQLANFVLALGKLPFETVIGDASRGEQLYVGKGACAQCHALNGRGSAFGPDLTGIGLKRGAAHLRQSLLDPAADVPKSFAQYRPGTSLPENYLQVRLVTRAGRRLSGVRVNEDTFSIQVRELNGHVHSFFKEELKELHKDWGKSLMPSYRGVFTATELEDVVAFLVSLRGAR